MNPNDMNDFRAEFDKFVREKCTLDPEAAQNANTDQGDPEDNEPVPAFVDELADKLLAPIHSGVYLSRLDIKRVAEGIDESLPIKDRKKMIKALFRHTVKREYLRKAFDEFNRHLNGRILIYEQLSEAFPSSKAIFDEKIVKINKTKKMFDQIVHDFEEIEPTDDPMFV